MRPPLRWTVTLGVALAATLTNSFACAPGSAGGRHAARPTGDAAARGPSHAAAPRAPRGPLADRADTAFWRALHAGQYDAIPDVAFLLQAAYLQNPRDPRTTAHLGFLHAWAAAERARLDSVPPTITDHVILARTYFARAEALDPTDARVQGFHAVFEMSDAGTQRDSAAFAVGLARGRAAITAWPEFNWFTVGYTLGGRDHTSPLYGEGLEMQWRTLAACERRSIDRADPAATVAARGTVGGEAGETDPRRRRACGNSWIAPHNVEGFFLNMGDMLVKSGDWRTGVKVYALARRMTSYPAWTYRDVLEARIANAAQNVVGFQHGARPGGGSAAAGSSGARIMLESRFACAACHQE